MTRRRAGFFAAFFGFAVAAAPATARAQAQAERPRARADARSADPAAREPAQPSAGRSPSQQLRSVDVRDLFGRGYMLQDRNADDVIDFVDARIILPASPTRDETVAAANIAARLGFETSALNLGLAGFDDARVEAFSQPVVIVGSRNRLAARAPQPAAAPERDRSAPASSRRAGAFAEPPLAAGEGAITIVSPDALFRAGAVRVEGGDATGLMAAAGYLASRYPNVWAVRGPTYAEVGSRLERYLRGQGIPVDTVTLDRIVVDANRHGVSRLSATVRVPDDSAFARAVAALRREVGARDSVAQGGAARGAEARDTTARIARPDSAERAAAAADTTRGPRVARSDLMFADLHRIDVRVVAPDSGRLVRLLPARPWPAREAAGFQPRESPDFTLSDLYTIRGLFRDTNQDLVPDRTEAYLSLGGDGPAAGAVDFAARVGLETAGMRLPFVRLAAQEDHPEALGFPILWGVGHYRTERLREEGRLQGPPSPGEGFAEVVKGGLDGRNALVVSAADGPGLGAIAEYLAGRAPWVWEPAKGQARLADLETDVRRFFQVRETPGQIALAGHKLRTWLARLEGRDIDSLGIELAVKEPPVGLDRWAAQLARARFPGAAVTATTFRTGFGEGRPIFEDELEIPWEVDEFRAVWAETLAQLRPGQRGRIEVRLSEPPAVRAGIEREIRESLAGRGIAAGDFDVVVLSAYKQGYSWLHDEILPRLRRLAADPTGPDPVAVRSTPERAASARAIGGIDITYHSLRDSREVRWQTVESDTRWLQEIYPIDAVLARELAIPDSVIRFAATRRASPVYTVRITDTAGREMLSASFDPKYVVRPFFDLFPEYEQVRVTTGWIHVEADGATVLDRRIATDPERFWQHLQTDTYGRIIEYVMDIQDGRPSPANAPYFDELRVELALSEPNYRIGIDEEVISSLEALHEDIYFETLTLFDLIGNRYGVGSLDYAGRVLPWIVPGRDGQPGRAKITLTGKTRGVPELVLTVRERGREPVRERYPLSPLGVDAPRLRALTARAGEEGLARLLFEVTALDSLESWEANRLRAAEPALDRQLLPAELLAGMVDVLGELHSQGIAQQALSYDRIGQLSFRFVLKDSTSTFRREASLERSRSPASTRRPVLLAPGYRPDGQPLVQWRTPIPPAENDSVLARLATFPGMSVYHVATSFLGQPIFAVDVLPPMEAARVSQAKLNALKPTLLLSGRQHANEVSSTSHILKLGELLATDSSYRALLRKVNVVLHPVTNPDGARLAYDMQLVNPDFMLHAGYLGALGVDATAGSNTDDPVYPESKARPHLQETWLPDIYMNLHGYPSHEWVQLFAGYSAWVRGRTGTQRSWWAPRGWFVPGFAWVDDPRHPEIRTAQFAILDSIAAAIAGQPAVAAMSRSLYARYQKYGTQDVENFREDFRNGLLVYRALRGREVSGTGPNNPRITYFAVTTEAPDETARGDWLELVASAGLAHTSALLRYLAGGQNRVERAAVEDGEFVNRSVFRRKPVLPPDTAAAAAPGAR